MFHFRRLTGALLLAAAGLAHAQGEPIDVLTRTVRYVDEYRVNLDGTFEEIVTSEVKMLKPEGVERASQAAIGYNRSIQRARVTAAYTRKADGRRIDAPPGNILLDVGTGASRDPAQGNDYTQLAVAFPQVEVGDTTVLEYSLATVEALFPGHFSIASTVSRDIAFDTLVFRVDAPAALWAQAEAVGMRETANAEKDGRRVREWTYSNPRPLRSRRGPGAIYDPRRETAFYFSTLRGYGDIAAAYGVRASPKAAVTPRIRKLADEIAAGKGKPGDPREQARALYDWTARNIEYSGNCIGLGAVVPHDTDYILDIKTGDCKDHSTLLQALLAARGIKATQALVNADNGYQLPAVPVVSMVNHVINYLPDFNLFIDSTSADSPFGMLPFADQDKVALLVDGYKEGMKTPAAPPGSNEQAMKTLVSVAGDGTMSGTVEVNLRGTYAATIRTQIRNMSQDAKEGFVRNMFRSGGRLGSGALKADDPQERLPAYHYASDFEVLGLLPLPAAGAFTIYPLMVNPSSVSTFVGDNAQEPDPANQATCNGGRSSEEYVFTLPKSVQVQSLPPNVNLTEGAVSYTASYALKDNVLSVKRIIDDRTPGSVCSPAVLAGKHALAAKVAADLQGLVVYK
ncbi:MAG: hypothetical protein JWN73_1561 [Betaproteobacteria bacterium]|nr:hypothetical protein [Betaproteobacteria bacterium]